MRKSLEGVKYQKVHYSKVPKKYEEYEYFIPDSGYCVMGVPSMFMGSISEKEPYWMYEIAIPTELFLRKVEEGKVSEEKDFLLVDVDYQSPLGVVDDWEEIWEDEIETVEKDLTDEDFRESTIFNLNENGAELILNFYNPNQEEVEVVNAGHDSLSIFFQEYIMILIWKFREMEAFETVIVHDLEREKYLDYWEGKSIPLKVILNDICTREKVSEGETKIDILDADFLLKNLRKLKPTTKEVVFRSVTTLQSIYSTEELMEIARKRQLIEQIEKFS